MLNSTAVGLNPPSPPRGNQMRRPTANGRMACSAAPLSIVKHPPVRYPPRVGHWFVAYVNASPTEDFGSTRAAAHDGLGMGEAGASGNRPRRASSRRSAKEVDAPIRGRRRTR